MSRYVFDIETDGLLEDCTKVWTICMYNLDTHELEEYLPFQGDMRWKEKFDSAKLLVGHFIKSFDLAALEKIYEYILPRSVQVHDTLIFSMVMNYRRFGNEGHSLERWGEFLGHPKVEHEDWTQYSDAMSHRCREDVMINVEVYNIVLREFLDLAAKQPRIKVAMKAEHYVAEWSSRAELHGWPFDKEAASSLFNTMGAELEETRNKLTPLLGMRSVIVDKKNGEVVVKEPKWIKAGCYDKHTADWHNVDPWSGYEGEARPIEGPYCRVIFRPLDLNSVADVKMFLFKHGWEPTTWNYKRILNEDTGRYELRRTSPKITEDSLEVMQGNGKLYCDFLTTKSRYGILKTWLEKVDENGNLHGSCFTIGTPSMRVTHGIIVNIPSGEIDKEGNPVSKWGPEMRKLFRCKPGWVLIGCDSKGNQARGLAHYLKSEEYTKILLEGDVHQYDADILTDVLRQMGIDHVVIRARAKRILYAFLFGASGKKLWSYIFDVQDATQGNKLKIGFTRAVPGFEELLKKLEKVYNNTKRIGEGYIPSIAGNRIYVDSPHKLLVYLLQSCEKFTCSAATMLTMQRLEEANIPFIPCIFYHDEIDFQVPEEYAEQAKEIGARAFKDGPELLGITIMDGDGKIGKNWFDVH